MLIDLTEAQKGYLAGFIDGEGYVGIARHKNGKGRGMYYSPQISVYNSDPEVLFMLQRWTGLGSVNVHQREDKPAHHRIGLTWRIGGAKAKELLTEILPHLQIKRKQAELLISCPSDGCFRNNMNEQLAVKEAIMILNQGGK